MTLHEFRDEERHDRDLEAGPSRSSSLVESKLPLRSNQKWDALTLWARRLMLVAQHTIIFVQTCYRLLRDRRRRKGRRTSLIEVLQEAEDASLRGPLLPSSSHPINTSGSDPPHTSNVHGAALDREAIRPSSPPGLPNERTPLLAAGNLDLVLDGQAHFSPYSPKSLYVNSAHPPPVRSFSNEDRITHSLPSHSSSPSSSSTSSPSSSSSSLTLSVPTRSALKKPHTPPPCQHSQSDLSDSQCAECNGDEGRRDFHVNALTIPTPHGRKSVRFSQTLDETHVFEYGSFEKRMLAEHAMARSQSHSSNLGQWTKSGKTIVWQDGHGSPASRFPSSSSSAGRRSASSSAVDDLEAEARALFGDGFAGRLMRNWFLGNAATWRSSVSHGGSSGSSISGGSHGTHGGFGSSPPGGSTVRKFMALGDEGRFRDGMY